MTDTKDWAIGLSRSGISKMPAITGLTFLALVAVTACSTKPREMDMLVWSKVDWDPRQEQRDYGECYTHAKKAAYRKFHWRRAALSREVDEPTGALTPAAIMSKLQDIAGDEKLATVEIAEQCMEERGYRLLPVNRASR